MNDDSSIKNHAQYNLMEVFRIHCEREDLGLSGRRTDISEPLKDLSDIPLTLVNLISFLLIPRDGNCLRSYDSPPTIVVAFEMMVINAVGNR